MQPKCSFVVEILERAGSGSQSQSQGQTLGPLGGKTQTPTPIVNTPPLFTEPHIDYAESHFPPSDNAIYVDPVSPADLAV